jgi:Flp pilus assembly protein protease CpaA
VTNKHLALDKLIVSVAANDCTVRVIANRVRIALYLAEVVLKVVFLLLRLNPICQRTDSLCSLLVSTGSILPV